ADLVLAIADELSQLLELSLRRLLLALGARTIQLLARMLDLLRHGSDVRLKLDALLVSRCDGPPIRRELLVELLQALLQSVQEASLLRELLFEGFYFGVHRRQLLERADMLTGAQPFISS